MTLAVIAGAPDIYVIVDEVAGFIETDPNMTVDGSGARPATYEPDHIYVYPDTEDHVGYESGPGVRQNYAIIVDVVVDDKGENALESRDREVTDELRAHVANAAERVRLNQRSAFHDYLRISRIEWLALRGLNYRGVRLHLEGYRLWS